MADRTRLAALVALVGAGFVSSGACSVVGGFGKFVDEAGDGGSGLGGRTGDGDGDDPMGGRSGDGGSGGGAQKPKLTNCAPLGGVFDLFTEAEGRQLLSDSNSWDLEANQNYVLVAAKEGAYFGVVIDGSEHLFKGRYIPETQGKDLGDVFVNALANGGQVETGTFKGKDLRFYGFQGNQVTEFEFEVNDGDLEPGSELVNILADACDPTGTVLGRTAFDLDSPSTKFAFTCEEQGNICDGAFCRVSNNPCNPSEHGECCDEECDREWSLRFSDQPSEIVAVGPAGSSDDGADGTLDLQSYVRVGDRHLLFSEFDTFYRGGTVAEVGERTELHINDRGESYVLAAAPNADGTGAIGFGLQADDGLLNGTMSYEVANIAAEDFGSLDQPSVARFTPSFFFETPDALPQRPTMTDKYIVLGSEDATFSRTVTFSAYGRDGELAVDRALVYKAPMGSTVRRVYGAMTHDLLFRAVVAWIESDGYEVKIRAQRMSCQ